MLATDHFFFIPPFFMSTFSPYQWARALGLVAGGAFILCFLWGLLLVDPVLRELHMNSLRIYFLGAGFVGANALTVIVGTILSAIWGAIAGTAIALCLNHCRPQAR